MSRFSIKEFCAKIRQLLLLLLLLRLLLRLLLCMRHAVINSYARTLIRVPSSCRLLMISHHGTTHGGAPGGLAGGPHAYYNSKINFVGSESHRVHAHSEVRETFFL